GLVSIAVAVTSEVAQYFMHKPTPNSSFAATEAPISAASSPPATIVSLEAAPGVAAIPPIAIADPTASPTMPVLATATPKRTAPEQRRKKRVTKSKAKAKRDSDGTIEGALRSLFQPQSTPSSNHK